MDLFTSVRDKGISYRPTDEEFYAEVLREVESDVRRSGLWARALSDSNMDKDKASAVYIKLRVQSLKEEFSVLIADLVREKIASIEEREVLLEAAETEARKITAQANALIVDTRRESIELNKKCNKAIADANEEAEKVNSKLAATVEILVSQETSSFVYKVFAWIFGFILVAEFWILFTGIARVIWTN